ncbi:MAG: thioredoxin family protein [Sedimentisphaerales bacterium]|nr:thioredoxin family protein [Sedimentisphaerales bacterium]
MKTDKFFTMKSIDMLLSKKIRIIFLFVTALCASGQADEPNSAAHDTSVKNILLAEYENESSSARIEPARLNSQFGIAVIFEGTGDLHYYAKPETAASPQFILTVKAKSDDFSFGEPIFPEWETFIDPEGKKVEVYVGNFTVFVPIPDISSPETSTGEIDVTISGQACTSKICLMPFEKSLQAEIDWSQRELWQQVSFKQSAAVKKPVEEAASARTLWFALGLAFLAGLALNIMPCVWPVLPLIVMRIVNQAKNSRSVSIALGLSFCIGILLFFAILAGVNIALQLIYGTVLQWGDQFRNPIFVSVMAILLVLLSLFMFGVFNITVPSAIASRQSTGKGYFSAVGMGLLAAVLSTPCSFGILAAAFAWAQSQPLGKSTLGIMFIGLGMALPYFVLTSVPGMLSRLPKPGRWMEIFKQGIGFILLIIAVKMITALPEARTSGVLYFAVVLSFCAWMWGTWIDFNTKPVKRWLVRIMAIALAGVAGWTFLSTGSSKLINWQSYDNTAIQKAIDANQPVLIKFTADWCFSCQVVEKSVYARKDIARLIEQKNVLAIKADTTEKHFPATIALQEVFNEPGVPVTMLLLPGPNPPIKWRGILFAEDLKKHLESLSDNTKQ